MSKLVERFKPTSRFDAQEYKAWLKSDAYKALVRKKQEHEKAKQLHEGLLQKIQDFARKRSKIVLRTKDSDVIVGRLEIGGIFRNTFVPMFELAERLVNQGYLAKPQPRDVHHLQYEEDGYYHPHYDVRIVWYRNRINEPVLALHRVDQTGYYHTSHGFTSSTIEVYETDPTWEMLCVVDALYFRQLGIPLGIGRMMGPINLGFKKSTMNF